MPTQQIQQQTLSVATADVTTTADVDSIDTVRCVTCGDEWPCGASEIELQAPGTSPFGALHRPEVYDAMFMRQYRANYSGRLLDL